LFNRAYLRVLAFHTLYGLSLASFLLFPKYAVSALDASPAEVGRAMALFGVANFLTVPFVGVGVDRLGRRAFLVAGVVLMGLSALAFVWIDHVGAGLYFCRALQGCSFACVWIAAATLVADSVPSQRLAQALALLGATMHGTNALVPVVVERASEAYGWSPVFLAAAGATVLALGLVAGLGSAPLRREGQESPSALFALLRRGALQRAVTVSLCVGATVATLTTFIQPYALERGIVRIGGFFLAFSLTVLFVRVILGSWMDRVDRWRVCAVAMSGYALLLLFAPSVRAATLPLLGVLFGLVHGFFLPSFNAMTLVGTDARERGRVLALLSGGFNVGHALSTFTLGSLAAAVGYGATFTATLPFALAGGALLLAVRGASRWSGAAKAAAPARQGR